MTNIDYGLGRVNIDRATGTRYGVIPLNDLASHAWDEIQSHGTDEDWEDFTEQLKSDLASAIGSVIKDYSSLDPKELASDLFDDLDLGYESTGDYTRYSYSKDGTELQVCSDGDIFVLKSPYFAMASYCSPCAPGAGHLRTEGDVKTYCLGPEWFDSEHPMPYQCFAVTDCQEVAA